MFRRGQSLFVPSQCQSRVPKLRGNVDWEKFIARSRKILMATRVRSRLLRRVITQTLFFAERTAEDSAR